MIYIFNALCRKAMDPLPDDKGSDTQGGTYSSIQDLWVNELGKPGEEDQKEVTWYPKAVDYWNNIPATIDGMMGGLTEISKRDLRTSHDFLKYFLDGKQPGRKPTNATRALDCGAGIGRVTTNLLLPLFDTVDMVEQCSKFVDEAKRTIKSGKMGHFYCSGLQDFTFTEKYDIIWIQWVIGHLTDEHLIDFLKRCKSALTPYGLLCIKDNTCENGFVFDKEDSSVTRSDKHFRALFSQADMTVVKVLLQPNFPKKLFPVRIYALE
eukprot:Phypoly_transcript_14250.p1 GENE.Phypoly_transcript_14250~~Phypoly_transcript_14250.p1  ORF type:complete len:265 (+),score=29.15 Phypoly_transcript_14250:158-952(+)